MQDYVIWAFFLGQKIFLIFFYINQIIVLILISFSCSRTSITLSPSGLLLPPEWRGCPPDEAPHGRSPYRWQVQRTGEKIVQLFRFWKYFFLNSFLLLFWYFLDFSAHCFSFSLGPRSWPGPMRRRGKTRPHSSMTATCVSPPFLGGIGTQQGYWFSQVQEIPMILLFSWQGVPLTAVPSRCNSIKMQYPPIQQNFITFAILMQLWYNLILKGL